MDRPLSRLRWMLPRVGLPGALLLALALSPRVDAQLAAFRWTPVGDPGGSTHVSATRLIVVGPDGGCADPTLTTSKSLVSVAPHDGTIFATFTFKNLDVGISSWHFEHPITVLNGIETVLGNPSSCFSDVYKVALPVLAGDSFGFGIYSKDCLYGPGVAEITDFVFSPDTWLDLGKALDPRRRWGVSGKKAGGDFGVAVCSAGDVNGDGLVDVAVGSPMEGNGKVRIHDGDTGGMLNKFSGSGRFGSAVDFVGDTDLDGRTEIIVGSPFAGSAVSGQLTVIEPGTGQLVHVALGQNLWFLGTDVAGLGDVDGDGRPDFAAGAPLSGSFQPGQVLVYSGADGSLLHTLGDGVASDDFGASVAAAGDVDMDGFPDILVGAWRSGLTGKALVYSGANGALIREHLGVWPGGDFGQAVTSLGDVDLDGFADYAASAPDERVGLVELGSVTAFSGQAGAPLYKLFGGQASARFGASLTGGADVDADAMPDLIVGSHKWVDDLGELVGRVDVFHGSDGVPVRELLGGLGDQLGRAVGLAGDVNGDGVVDLITGSTQALAGGVGLAEVFDGLAAADGQRPRLKGTGSLVPGTPFTMKLERARPHAFVQGVVGFTEMDVAFAGGFVLPAVDVIVPGFTDGRGRLELSGIWPVDSPAFSKVWVQMWIIDPTGPLGFAASNGLRLTTGLPP